MGPDCSLHSVLKKPNQYRLCHKPLSQIIFASATANSHAVHVTNSLDCGMPRVLGVWHSLGTLESRGWCTLTSIQLSTHKVIKQTSDTPTTAQPVFLNQIHSYASTTINPQEEVQQKTAYSKPYAFPHAKRQIHPVVVLDVVRETVHKLPRAAKGR